MLVYRTQNGIFNNNRFNIGIFRPTVFDSNIILSSQVKNIRRTCQITYTRLKILYDDWSTPKISWCLGTSTLEVCKDFVIFLACLSYFSFDNVTRIHSHRKYGVIENRFCYEGGSRCGKGEGLFVCFTDQGDDITRCMNLAAESKLATRKRALSRNMSGKNKSPNIA